MDAIVLPIDAPILIVEFTVPGEPVSKARARFTKRGSAVHAYTPQKTLDGERAVALAFRAASHARPTDDEDAYRVEAEFYSGTRQRRDIDNMMKLLLDGLNGVAWVDDNQVTQIEARKSWVDKANARTVVRVFLVGRLNRPTAACVRCGATFRTYKSWQSNPNGKKYCTPKCAYAHRVEKRERTCAQCGGHFLAWGETKETKYCSRECASAARRASVECTQCGTEFTKQKCHIRAKNYCSPECQSTAAKERRSKSMPGTCQVCGSGTTRKEYVRCNPCKLASQQVSGKPIRPIRQETAS